jgi:hypothetical protein
MRVLDLRLERALGALAVAAMLDAAAMANWIRSWWRIGGGARNLRHERD